MDRRAFLSIVAGSPLIFGLRQLLAQDPAPAATPDWLNAALKRMKETRRFGVVIVIPPGKEAQSRLGNALLARLPKLLRSPDEDVETFVGNVFICLGETRARLMSGGKLEGDPEIADGIHRLLLDPEGRTVAADRVAPAVFENPAKFRESIRAFVGGDNGSRLRDLAKSVEGSLPEDIQKVIEVISRAPRQVETEAASIELKVAMNSLECRMNSIASWLLNLALMKENDKTFLQARIRTIFWDYYIEESADPSPCLPFGIKTETLPLRDPCPACGRMVFAQGKARKFISFLER